MKRNEFYKNNWFKESIDKLWGNTSEITIKSLKLKNNHLDVITKVMTPNCFEIQLIEKVFLFDWYVKGLFYSLVGN